MELNQNNHQVFHHSEANKTIWPSQAAFFILKEQTNWKKGITIETSSFLFIVFAAIKQRPNQVITKFNYLYFAEIDYSDLLCGLAAKIQTSELRSPLSLFGTSHLHILHNIHIQIPLKKYTKRILFIDLSGVGASHNRINFPKK